MVSIIPLVGFVTFVVVLYAGSSKNLFPSVLGTILLIVFGILVSWVTQEEVEGSIYQIERILSVGQTYEVIGSGELDRDSFWVVVKDTNGKTLVASSKERVPTNKKVAVVRNPTNNSFNLIPYEKPLDDPKGWGAEEAVSKP